MYEENEYSQAEIRTYTVTIPPAREVTSSQASWARCHWIVHPLKLIQSKHFSLS